MNIQTAKLANGKTIEYIKTDNPPRGTMKYTYFTPDGDAVVQFFNRDMSGDSDTRKRLEAIIGRYNPTLSSEEGGAIGGTVKTSNYFKKRYCWPVAIVDEPEFGIVCPIYPSRYFFGEDSSDMLRLGGRDKKSNWFTSKNRKYLKREELGNFRSMLKISLNLARAVRRLHSSGLAHSDLSNNNVLIDPKTGSCVIIDIDTLVVPGIFNPSVAGTRGYIAPEVLETLDLEFGDSEKNLPSVYSDLHALPVLIYEYLFFRHPLIGKKIYCEGDAEEDDRLALGRYATFIENPTDTSNRPDDMKITIKHLGPSLEKLFVRAFVDGLHDPDMRPTAMEWETALADTLELLQKCQNPKCSAKYFVLADPKNPICPYCGRRVRDESIVRIKILSPINGRDGQWIETSELNISDDKNLFDYHIFSNIRNNEKSDREPVAQVMYYDGQWVLVNRGVKGMLSPKGKAVPVGGAVALSDNVFFELSTQKNGCAVRVSVFE
jgi:serine/threonine protein kinase